MKRLAVVMIAGLAAAGAVAACGGSSSSQSTSASHSSTQAHSNNTTPTHAATSTHAAAPKPPAPAPAYPRLLPAAQSTLPSGFIPAVSVRGQTAVWVARSQSGIALLSFNQSLAGLNLHSGTVDAGGSGWRLGPMITDAERPQMVAAFNGGFKFNTGAGGFESHGRVAVPLIDGRASIVTYADGSTDIGSWHQEVPASGRTVASVRQNLELLIDHGAAAGNLDCVICWGATVGSVSAPARSALGVTADGRLIYVGGEHLTVADLAQALLGARVVRAAELDINPDWVAAYLYGHRGGVGPLAPVPIVPNQTGVAGQFLVPYSRDFFTIVAR